MMDAFVLRPDGTVVGLYTDMIDLRALGHVQAKRASAVEWDETAQVWRARIFATGEVLGPFRRRGEAVDAERHVLAERLCASGVKEQRASDGDEGLRLRASPKVTLR